MTNSLVYYQNIFTIPKIGIYKLFEDFLSDQLCDDKNKIVASPLECIIIIILHEIILVQRTSL